jgi:hypothetical protein
MTREGRLSGGCRDPDAPPNFLGGKNAIKWSTTPKTGVGSKGIVGLRLPKGRINAVFGDPDASSKKFWGNFAIQ